MAQPNAWLFQLLEPLQRVIEQIVSGVPWDHLTAKDTRTRNNIELAAWDALFYQSSGSTSASTPSHDRLVHLQTWVQSALNNGPRNIDWERGRQLLEAICEEDVGTNSEELQVGKRQATKLKRTYHLQNSLAEISGHLFRELSQLSDCCTDDVHIARMHLNGFGVEENSLGSFCLFISRPPTPECKDPVWQDTELCGVSLPYNHISEDIAGSGKLCELINDCKLYEERLLLDFHQIAKGAPILSKRQISLAAKEYIPKVSLAELIEDGRLRQCSLGGNFLPEEKAALCLNLSLGLFHLSKDTWIRQGWSIESIFFQAKEPGSTLDAERPYLSTPLIIHTEGNATSRSNQPQAIAGLAKSRILSFAQVLMEITMGERLPNDLHADREKFIYIRNLVDLTDGQGHMSSVALERRKQVVRRAGPFTLAAIQACLDFFRFGTDKEPNPDWLFTQVVLNLEHDRILFTELDIFLPQQWGDIPASPGRKHNLVQSRCSTVNVENGLPIHGEISKRQHEVSSADWFNDLEVLNEVLSGGIDHRHTKVRVAVIDTGIIAEKAGHFNVSDDMYCDFTCTDEAQKTIHDDDGHGTSIVELIYRICECAEVYIARIWKNKEAEHDTKQLAVKAVEWAIEKKVDIICMAFGFSTGVPHLREALKKARCASILVFAAASNSSNQREITQPAVWSDFAFCIFSTDAGCKNSRGINPKGLDSNNFAIFGEEVELEGHKLGSGTSLSTAIACGLAARLLDFSRQEEVTESKYGKFGNSLKDKMEMTKVLRQLMSVEDQGYHCIVPWRLLPRHTMAQADGQLLSAEAISDARERVCMRISLCLDTTPVP